MPSAVSEVSKLVFCAQSTRAVIPGRQFLKKKTAIKQMQQHQNNQ